MDSGCTHIGKVHHVIVMRHKLLFVFYLTRFPAHRFNKYKAHDNNHNEHRHYGNRDENRQIRCRCDVSPDRLAVQQIHLQHVRPVVVDHGAVVFVEVPRLTVANDERWFDALVSGFFEDWEFWVAIASDFAAAETPRDVASSRNTDCRAFQLACVANYSELLTAGSYLWGLFHVNVSGRLDFRETRHICLAPVSASRIVWHGQLILLLISDNTWLIIDLQENEEGHER